MVRQMANGKEIDKKLKQGEKDGKEGLDENNDCWLRNGSL
jgi:hypothetical protein